MLSTLPKWHEKPIASVLTVRDRLHHYNNGTIPVTHQPYMPMGSFAISASSPNFATMFIRLNDANAAVVAYTDALAHTDAERWKVATDRFEKLEAFPFETNAQEDSKSHLNLATVCDNKDKISKACLAVQMYYTPANHSDADKLKEMEEINIAAGEFALLDTKKIKGRRTIVECEANLDSADRAMPLISESEDTTKQAEAIEAYKTHASIAVTLAKMIPTQQKSESLENIQKRVQAADETLKQYYADDYDRLMREAENVCLSNN